MFRWDLFCFAFKLNTRVFIIILIIQSKRKWKILPQEHSENSSETGFMQSQEYGVIKKSLDVRHLLLYCSSHGFYWQFPHLFYNLKMKNRNIDRS